MIRYRMRTFTSHRACEGTTDVNGPTEAIAIARAVFADLDSDVEHFVVLALNARNRITGYKTVSQGTQTSCLTHPREVFRAAIALGAATIIGVHNHPSGDPTSSDQDDELTFRLRSAGDLLGIPLLDHIILGSGDRAFAYGPVAP